MFYRNAQHAAPQHPKHRKRNIVLLALVPLLLATAAYAYFDLDYGTGHVNVASLPSLTIDIQAPAGTPLAPGAGSETIAFSLVNQLSHAQVLNAESYTLVTDAAGGIYDTNSNAYVDTCQASWFTVVGSDGGVTLPTTLQNGQSLSNGTVTVTMPANAGVDQSACEGLAPQIQIGVS